MVIDEFQDFLRVNKSVVCGSVYSMMQKLFKNKKEPLYGRATGELKVKAFAPSVLKKIIAEANPGYTNEDLLALFSFTGGVAKYVQLLVQVHL